MTHNMTRDKQSLQRFLDAQESIYKTVLSELEAGHKTSHWMWFIFPQIAGLGRSETSRYFAIRDLDEARRYLAHPVLGHRLLECTQTLLNHEGVDIDTILGYPDDRKLQSSMTLFIVANQQDDSPFAEVLDAFFRGDQDLHTLDILGLG